MGVAASGKQLLGSLGMGATSRRHFESIKKIVETRVGKVPLHTRYHLEPRTLDLDYEMCSDVLGSGASGDVKVATRKLNPSQKVAVKSFTLKNITKADMTFIRVELENYLSLDHPHIARLLDVYESKDHLHLVMECLEGGDVFSRIHEKKTFTEAKASEALRQMLLALNYMHSHGYVHRDVKLENLVYDAKGSDYLKLIDFGFSARWEPNLGTKLDECLGTAAYCAPEVLKRSYTSQCDLWSLGVVAYILIGGKMPFYGPDWKMQQQILRGSYLMEGERWAHISNECKDFIRSLLQVDPSRRLSAQGALEHPWITKHSVACKSRTGIAQDNVMSEEMSQVLKSLRQYGSTSEFRRCCLQALAWSCSNEDQAKVREQFLTLNRSLTGSATFEELHTAMIKQYPNMGRAEFKKICYVLDHNYDQTIHYSDFLAAMMGSQISLTKDTMKIAFQKFDVHNSGLITASGLLKAGIAEYIFEEVVESGGSISFEQFCFYLSPSFHTICSSDDEPVLLKVTPQFLRRLLVLPVLLECIPALA
jgi:calcium-dependent protein kinase